jgi:hypothetical protein
MDSGVRLCTPPHNGEQVMNIIMKFATLAAAESFLQAQGLKLVSDSCDWTNAKGYAAGIYPVEGSYGVARGFRVEINRNAKRDNRVAKRA